MCSGVFVCIRVCVGPGQREHSTCSVGAGVQVKTLEHSFSGVLSYAQASFLGHMMNSSSVREDVVGRSNECVALAKSVVRLQVPQCYVNALSRFTWEKLHYYQYMSS